MPPHTLFLVSCFLPAGVGIALFESKLVMHLYTLRAEFASAELFARLLIGQAISAYITYGRLFDWDTLRHTPSSRAAEYAHTTIRACVALVVLVNTVYVPSAYACVLMGFTCLLAHWFAKMALRQRDSTSAQAMLAYGNLYPVIWFMWLLTAL